MRPDPVLTASVYYSHRLDAVIHGAVAPFRRRLREHDPGGGWSLWMVRYARGGDHLKLRLHGPEEESPLVRRLLAEAVDGFLASLPADGGEEPRPSRPSAPALDEEDETESDHPDRALLWTRYRRSHVSLGPPVFLDDDRYVALMCSGLALGAELALDSLVPDAAGRVPGSARQKALLKALVAGLAALDLGAEERAGYLAYHRDWLLRFSMADREAESGALARFDARAEGMRGMVAQLGRVAAAQWGSAPPAAPGGGWDDRWRRALADLQAHLVPYRGDPAYHPDPFTDDPVLPPVFKVFHGLANQLGLSMVEEAFVHHLLLRAAAGEEAAAQPAHAGA